MFHLRFTPYDISGYTFDFLKSYDKYIIAREHYDDEGNALLHYHILIDTDLKVKSVRDAAKMYLKIPPAGKGKNNKYYALIEDWRDVDYITKYYDFIDTKGFSQGELLSSAVSGKSKYLDKVKVTELSGDKAPAVPLQNKEPKVPFQQAVIASAAADWAKYKRESQNIDIDELKKFVCAAMREHGKGINVYLVKEICYAVLFDDLDYREYVLNKIVL